MPNLSFDNNSSISELKSSRKKTDDEDNYGEVVVYDFWVNHE